MTIGTTLNGTGLGKVGGSDIGSCPTPRIVLTTEIKTKMGQNNTRLTELLIQITKELDRLCGALPQKPCEGMAKNVSESTIESIFQEIVISQDLLNELEIEVERLKNI